MEVAQGFGPWSAADYRNGSDVQSDNAYYDRITQQAVFRSGPYLTDTSTSAEILAYDLKTQGFGDDWSLDEAALKPMLRRDSPVRASGQVLTRSLTNPSLTTASMPTIRSTYPACACLRRRVLRRRV